jgi:2'-5' RNA ligase
LFVERINEKMDYAIVVYFDQNADKYISQLMRNICDAGTNTYMLDVGIKPHLTLAAFKENDVEKLLTFLNEYANGTSVFEVKFLSLGIFPYNSSVIFLAPVVEGEFIKLHKNFNSELKKIIINFEPYYLPGEWVPHCTLATRMHNEELHRALEVSTRDFKPLVASITHIGLVQCNPFKEIVAFELNR